MRAKKKNENLLMKCAKWTTTEGFTWEKYGSDHDPDMLPEYKEAWEVSIIRPISESIVRLFVFSATYLSFRPSRTTASQSSTRRRRNSGKK